MRAVLKKTADGFALMLPAEVADALNHEGEVEIFHLRDGIFLIAKEIDSLAERKQMPEVRQRRC